MTIMTNFTTLRSALLRAAAAAACAAFTLPAASRAADAAAPAQGPTFKKIKLSGEFFSEGAHVADFNKDGKLDYEAGPFWYEGPDFQKKHTIYEAKPIDPKGYSANFLSFTHDVNNDSWPDVIVIGFPGQSAGWYQNPQGKEGNWERHVIHPEVDNESPVLGDLTGDGKPELVFHTKGLLGYATPDPSDPKAKWVWHKASSKPDGRFQRYTHGFGFGDVNGDGKNDILEAKGWWEQPAKLEGDPDWAYHPADFGAGGAQMFAYDVDGDGDNDVITSHSGHGYGLAWYENTKEGNEIKFTPHWVLSPKPEEKLQGVQFSQLHGVDLFDMNGDGLKDVVTGKRFWAHGPGGDPEPNAPAVLYWFELKRGGGPGGTGAAGKAEFIAHKIDDDSGVGTQVTAADVNGDKLGDVVVGNKKGQFVFIQEPKK